MPGPAQTPPDDLRLPTSPTGRVPQWVRDEVAGRPPADTRFRSWEPGATSRATVTSPGRRRRGRRAFAVVAALAVVATGAFVVLDRRDDASAATGAAGAGDVVSSSSYRFVHTVPGSGDPVGYDPCTPIRFEVRPDGAPPGADSMVDEAIASVAAVTGLRFERAGTTTRGPADAGPVTTPAPGQRWDPVLVAWADPSEAPMLEDRVAGYAGSVPSSPAGGRPYLRTGEVVIDGPGAQALLTRSDGRAHVVAILTHEVGHLVGLAHVDDPAQLMHAENSGLITRFGAGDLAGLRALGEIDCEG